MCMEYISIYCFCSSLPPGKTLECVYKHMVPAIYMNYTVSVEIYMYSNCWNGRSELFTHALKLHAKVSLRSIPVNIGCVSSVSML